MSKLRSIAKDKPNLAVVPFDEGTVQCIALNLQGRGALAQPAGRVVQRGRKILGSSIPSRKETTPRIQPHP
ncbi:hypothetical protein [Cohnella faecalis]|uniref:Uncharacterized protein n=1 Tax=Cohnella faecalis TaxID=2315694 RepID=A0A398CMT4_9BACL|nr:hypothetical protein [Cohnella faecalis]RIE03602.1 hypothetical protein D3H35_10710 [Cohnella faecalis]